MANIFQYLIEQLQTKFSSKMDTTSKSAVISFIKDTVFIFKKEMTDAIRDRRSISMMILPVLIFPVMFCALNTQISSAQNDVSENIPVAVSEHGVFRGDVAEHLSSVENISIIRTDDIVAAIKDGNVLLAIDCSDETTKIIYDQNSVRSTTALSQVIGLIDTGRQAAIADAMINSGADPSLLGAFACEPCELSAYTGTASNSLLVSLVPMLIVMFVFSGGTAVAVDTFCGELERGTMESLILTQVRRGSILAAKMAAVFSFSLTSLFLSLAGYILAVMLNPNVAALYGADGGLSVSIPTLLLALLVAFAFTTLAVSAMTLLSITSRSVKEGQMRTSILTIIPTLIGGITMYIEVATVSKTSMLIPVFNVIILFKQIFAGTVQTDMLMFTLVSCFVITAACVALSLHRFRSEKLFSK